MYLIHQIPPPKDANERNIEQAITFSSTTMGEPLPDIKILAMNASATGGKRDKNADSIVLKITYNDESILLPGDATNITWRTINPAELASNYFLISHHGAKTHESTSAEILSAVDPQAVFVSVGRYKRYFHPTQSVITQLLDSSSLNEDDALRIFVTYFNDTHKHRRIQTSSLLFTTLNNGTMTINLGAGTTSTSREKRPTTYRFGHKSYIADKDFAFREKSSLDPDNEDLFFSALIKNKFAGQKVCFFTLTSRGSTELSLDSRKTSRSSSSGTCEHAFLVKQNSEDEEIIIYLTPFEAGSLTAVSEDADKPAAGASSMKAAGGSSTGKAAKNVHK